MHNYQVRFNDITGNIIGGFSPDKEGFNESLRTEIELDENEEIIGVYGKYIPRRHFSKFGFIVKQKVKQSE